MTIIEIEEKRDVSDPNLYTYIKTNKLKKILFLSTKSYFYEADELLKIKSIVFLKKLNDIIHLDRIIENVYHSAPVDTIICGSFINTEIAEVGHYRKLFEMMYNFLVLNGNRTLSLKRVISYLTAYNFKLLNVSEINGVTYFHAKKIKNEL